MRIKAVEATSIDFTPYGRLFDMRNDGEGLIQSFGEGWSDRYTVESLLDTPASLGNTHSTATPFLAAEMERHGHSKKAQFCMDEPIVVLLAEPTEENRPPRAEDTIAVIIRPGTVAVLNRDVWHSASHGLSKAAYYYWSCHVCDGKPSKWRDIEGGPVEVYAE